MRGIHRENDVICLNCHSHIEGSKSSVPCCSCVLVPAHRSPKNARSSLFLSLSLFFMDKHSLTPVEVGFHAIGRYQQRVDPTVSPNKAED